VFCMLCVCNVTVDDESVESSHVGNSRLTSGEIKQLQQNLRYVLVMMMMMMMRYAVVCDVDYQ